MPEPDVLILDQKYGNLDCEKLTRCFCPLPIPDASNTCYSLELTAPYTCYAMCPCGYIDDDGENGWKLTAYIMCMPFSATPWAMETAYVITSAILHLPCLFGMERDCK